MKKTLRHYYGLNYILAKRYVQVLMPLSQNVPLFGSRAFAGVIRYDEFIRALIQHDWRPYKFGHSDIYPCEDEDRERGCTTTTREHQWLQQRPEERKGAGSRPSLSTLRRTNPSEPLISDPLPPEVWDNTRLLLKSPRLWCYFWQPEQTNAGIALTLGSAESKDWREDLRAN